MKTRGLMWVSVAMCLGACSDIPEVCEDEQGGAISCELLDMSPDMPADATPDLPIDLDVSDLAPDLARDLGVEDAAPDLEVDMCMPAEMLQVCNSVCGMQSDGCEGEVDCGEPLTQDDACADACGEQSDGCGGTIACEPCACVGGSPAQPTCGACNLGVSSCDGDTFSCDLYDIPGLDAQTDCDSALIYVNGAFDGMTSDGSRDNPFKTIADANAVAKDRGAIAILVGGNENVIYQEIMEVQDGVSVVGGWSSEWTVDAMRTPTVTPSLPSMGDLFGARVMDVADNDTLLANLRIVTPDFGKAPAGQSGRHNHGLYAFNAGKLVMRDMLIQAGKGEDGADGTDGQPGADGPDGLDGGPGCAVSFLACSGLILEGSVRIAHSTVTNVQCDPAFGDTSNGKNGLGGVSDEASDGPKDTATDGTDSPTGASGGIRGRNANNSRDGADGADGSALVFVSLKGGAGNCQAISFTNEMWVTPMPCNGSVGGDGLNGGGGGGGGGALHALTRFIPALNMNDPLIYYASGPDGGAGGVGGCAGLKGHGGLYGGMSVGMILSASQGIRISTSQILAGAGGSGGQGGNGGAGGRGGEGGLGGKQMCSDYMNGVVVNSSCVGAEFLGGDGGSGAAGVSGGAGGGGGGGSTFGIYCHDMTFTSDPSNNVQAGSLGMGGESEGNDGVSGLSSDLQRCE